VGKVLNVRMDEETHRRVVRIARASRRTKSEVVREAIAEYTRSHEHERSAHDAWKDVIGIAQNLAPDLSERSGERFTKLLKAERRRRKR
jgi:predicted DNA-binding protein